MIFRLLAEQDADPFVFTITVSAGSVLLITIATLYFRSIAKKKKNGDEPKEPPT